MLYTRIDTCIVPIIHSTGEEGGSGYVHREGAPEAPD